MPVSAQRVWSFRAIGVLVATALLMSGACRRAQSTVGQPPQPTADKGIPHFSGVDIVPTHNAGFLVRIHGAIVGQGEPLYVIDGAPMKIPSTRGIDWFGPEEIAGIKVLKYPHELAEYGANGANGVVVITTKQNTARSPRR